MIQRATAQPGTMWDADMGMTGETIIGGLDDDYTKRDHVGTQNR